MNNAIANSDIHNLPLAKISSRKKTLDDSAATPDGPMVSKDIAMKSQQDLHIDVPTHPYLEEELVFASAKQSSVHTERPSGRR